MPWLAFFVLFNVLAVIEISVCNFLFTKHNIEMVRAQIVEMKSKIFSLNMLPGMWMKTLWLETWIIYPKDAESLYIPTLKVYKKLTYTTKEVHRICKSSYWMPPIRIHLVWLGMLLTFYPSDFEVLLTFVLVWWT